MRLWMAALIAAGLVSGCTVKYERPRDAAQIAEAVYVADAPPELRLFTMKSNSTGAGAHTSLMVNGSQRVIFDPAGSFRSDHIIREGDVVYGVTDRVLDVYTRFHARETFRVQVQSLPVSAELAERVLQAVLVAGQQPDARCAASVSEILSDIPELGIKPTWFPNKLSEQFGLIPGVTEEELYEYDSDDNSGVLAAYDPERVVAK